MRECFDDPGILVAINLNRVDQGDLSFGATAEWFEDRRIFLDVDGGYLYAKIVPSVSTYPDFSKRKTFDLVCTSAPVNIGHAALPETLNKISLWYRILILSVFDSRHNIVHRLLMLDKISELLDEIIFENGVLLFCPPVSDLSKTSFLESFL